MERDELEENQVHLQSTVNSSLSPRKTRRYKSKDDSGGRGRKSATVTFSVFEKEHKDRQHIFYPSSPLIFDERLKKEGKESQVLRDGRAQRILRIKRLFLE